MSTRNDIIDGSLASSSRKGLVYTKKCGWIDLGHARPNAASALWHSILYETTSPALQGTTPITPTNLKDWFVIQFEEIMRHGQLSMGVTKYYAIKKKLPINIKQSVALAIFMNVSIAFEQMQATWPARMVTDSGFSVEDLVSNLVGFYRVMFPEKDFMSLCEPVSKEEALEIWDTYGPVGSRKNTSFSPVLFSLLTEKKDCAQTHPKPTVAALPSFLNTITPIFSPEFVIPYKFARGGNVRSMR